METAYNVIQSRITVKLDDPINLWFFGDIHRDTESCDVERWQWFLKRAKADVDSGQRTLFFGMGDYNDFASFKEQRKMKSGDLHETTLAKLDRMAQSDNAKLATEMQFMKGHILGLIEGNHTWKFHDGKTATEDLAERLQTQSLGWLCHYSLNVDFLNRDTSNTIHFVLCHGKAGGKTFGVTINQVGDLKSIFPAADVYCVSEDTEILTDSGWKHYDELDNNDLVYSMNNETFFAELTPVLDKVVYDYSGKMVSIKNKHTDQLLHPEHRVYYRYKVTDGYLINTAQHIADGHMQIKLPVAAYNESEAQLNKTHARLVGWIISEGHFKGSKGDHGSGILIYQKNKGKTDEIRSLLDGLRYGYSERLRDDGLTVFYIKKESADKIRSFVDNKKRLPEWIYTVSDETFFEILDAFMLGDGHWSPNKQSGAMYSAEKELLEDWNTACHLHGWRGILSYKKGGFKTGGWCLSISKYDTTELNTKQKISKVDYDGLIWCVTTGNGNFFARRNGKIFITGNCMGHDHQRGAWPVSVLLPTIGQGGWHIKQKRQFLCRSGSFKKAYTPGASSYEAGRLLRPADLGALKLVIRFHRDKKNGKDVITTDIEAII